MVLCKNTDRIQTRKPPILIVTKIRNNEIGRNDIFKKFIEWPA